MTTLFPNAKPVLPPTPKPFHMTEPFQQNGVWCFWLTADPDVIEFVRHLSCVLNVGYMAPNFFRRPNNRVMITIDPRYEHEEAWLWMHEQMETESNRVELPEELEILLEEVIPEDTNLNDMW